MNKTQDNTYRLDWLEPDDRPKFISFLKRHKRQTMNARLMTSAHIVNATYQGRVIGCGGLDLHYFKDYPEMFSLFVLPEFRSRGVGMALELARYQLAIRNGFKSVYIRVESQEAASLSQYRKNNSYFSFVEPEREGYRELCRYCEYYRKSCAEQRFMRIDLAGRMQQIVGALGQFEELPLDMVFN